MYDVAGEVARSTFAECVEEYGLDNGEAAGLALAVQQGWLFATVDLAAFECATVLLGPSRVVHLEDILEVAVASGQMTTTEREQTIHILEQRNSYRRRGS